MEVYMNVDSFLARKKVGLILRVFANQEDQVPKRVEMIREIIDRALTITVSGKQLFSRIDVLVWADPRFTGQSDCGSTAEALRQTFPSQKGSKIFISDVKHGDL